MSTLSVYKMQLLTTIYIFRELYSTKNLLTTRVDHADKKSSSKFVYEKTKALPIFKGEWHTFHSAFIRSNVFDNYENNDGAQRKYPRRSIKSVHSRKVSVKLSQI